MRDLDVLPPDLPHKLHVVIAGNAKRSACFHRLHHQANNLWYFWPAIHEVADKDCLSLVVSPGTTRSFGISELGQEFHEFIEASVDIADDVEWAVFMTEVVPERLPLNSR